MNFEKIENLGVQNVEIDNNNYYKVSIVWKNGEHSTMSFPVNGMEIVVPGTKYQVGTLVGSEAIKILRNNAHRYNREDFSFLDFI